jgi:tetratricopeptide (TPR) repeat protein
MTTQTNSKPLFSGEPFEQIIAILIATVTIMAALVGYLQVDANARNKEALRQAQAYAIEAVSLKASGEVESSAWVDLWRLWEELNSLAVVADEFDDPQAAERFRAVSSRVAQLSPVLSPPYFNPASDEAPNQAAFEADAYLVETTALSERFTKAFIIADVWNNKGDSYTAHLTLLAVTLFFFGISVTLAGRTRWIFVITGLVFTAITLVWVLIVYFGPVPDLPDEAIQAYARGVGWEHQDNLEQAIESFNQALALAPDYTNALKERGYAYFDAGQYDKATLDLETLLAAGQADSGVLSSLSWLYYIQGRFDDSSRLAQIGIEQYPANLFHQLDLGLTQLAAGNAEAAQAAYTAASNKAIQEVANARAAGQEPSVSLWAQLEEASVDLDTLAVCLNEQECGPETPAFDLMTNADGNQAAELSKQLRTLSIALEYTSQPPGPAPQAKIDFFEFALPIYDDAGEVADYEVGDVFPADSYEVAVLFPYEGMQDGQTVIWKVFYEGIEDPGLRLVETWSLGQAGEAEFILSYGPFYTFTPGNFWVEMYVDSHLVQEGGFTIEE